MGGISGEEGEFGEIGKCGLSSGLEDMFGEEHSPRGEEIGSRAKVDVLDYVGLEAELEHK